MRNVILSPGEHYHLYNRGVNKQNIFHERRDWSRFLFLLLYFQSFEPLPHAQRLFDIFDRSNGQHSVLTKIAQDLKKRRLIKLVSFCLMPNHFHLIVEEVEDGGTAKFMQKVLNSYTKYYNTKYGKSGHLFQGPYQAVHVTDDHQLLYLSCYAHKNPKSWSNHPWSSYGDFVGENRWPGLLVPDIILDQFKDKREYERFVKTNTAKELKEELGQHSVLAI